MAGGLIPQTASKEAPLQGSHPKKKTGEATLAASRLVLQEGLELRSRQNRLRLLEGLDLLVAGGLAKIKILQHEVAALVQLEVVVPELLELQLHGRQFLLRLCLVGLSLRLVLGLVHNLLGLCLDRRVRVLDKVLVRLLGILLRANGLRLHGLGVVDDLLDHAHHAARGLVLIVRLEAWRWGRANGLLLLAKLHERRFAVEALE